MLVAGMQPVYACICLWPSFEDAVAYTDEIFTGNIVSYHNEKHVSVAHSNGDTSWYWRHYYTFKVQRKWKGSANRVFVIESGGSSCSSTFDVTERDILIYGNATDKYVVQNSPAEGGNDTIPILYTSVCDRTSHPSSKYRDSYNLDLSRLSLLPEMQLLSKLNTHDLVVQRYTKQINRHQAMYFALGATAMAIMGFTVHKLFNKTSV